LAGGAGTNAEWEPIKERRQRTPAIVALVSEGLQLRNRSGWSWPILLFSGRLCFSPGEA